MTQVQKQILVYFVNLDLSSKPSEQSMIELAAVTTVGSCTQSPKPFLSNSCVEVTSAI